MTDELDSARLRRLQEEVSRLPRSMEPVRDAWPAIRDRIEAQRVRTIAPGAATAAASSEEPVRSRESWRAERPRPRRLVWVAAAAVALMALTSTVTVVVLQRRANDTRITTSSGPAVRSSDPRLRQVASPSLDEVFSHYDAAAVDLAGALRDRRARLDTRTLAVLDSCLARIDRAIAEARAALRQDPRNDVVVRLLTSSYQQKLDLLRRTASLPQGTN